MNKIINQLSSFYNKLELFLTRPLLTGPNFKLWTVRWECNVVWISNQEKYSQIVLSCNSFFVDAGDSQNKQIV